MPKDATRESTEVLPEIPKVRQIAPSQAPEIEPVVTTPSNTTEPYTNYKAFNDAHVIPGRVTCEGYAPRHPVDVACHTNFPLTGENVKGHIDHEHGGGFRLRVKRIKDRTSPFWDSLKTQGLEIQELRCGHCDAVMDVSATRMGLHFVPHRGKNRKSGVAEELLITFVGNAPIVEEDYVDDFIANSN